MVAGLIVELNKRLAKNGIILDLTYGMLNGIEVHGLSLGDVHGR